MAVSTSYFPARTTEQTTGTTFLPTTTVALTTISLPTTVTVTGNNAPGRREYIV